ncbi:UNVERIFIED_CONTAM: hypothetical protein DES50_11146 [Williamsia faeni]
MQIGVCLVAVRMMRAAAWRRTQLSQDSNVVVAEISRALAASKPDTT